MARIVLDSNVLVSAFLTRQFGGATFDLLSFAKEGRFELFLSNEILEETAEVLLRHGRFRRRLQYPDAAVFQYCQELARLALIVEDVPEIQVVRDPDDDMVLACAIAARADFLISRDKDLLVLDPHEDIKIVTPEVFLHLLRNEKSVDRS